jgi:hypothetical protein
MRTIYTDDHWENDPFLMLDRIRAVRAEQSVLDAFRTLQRLGVKPEQVEDKRLRRSYEAFLSG